MINERHKNSTLLCLQINSNEFKYFQISCLQKVSKWAALLPEDSVWLSLCFQSHVSRWARLPGNPRCFHPRGIPLPLPQWVPWILNLIHNGRPSHSLSTLLIESSKCPYVKKRLSSLRLLLFYWLFRDLKAFICFILRRVFVSLCVTRFCSVNCPMLLLLQAPLQSREQLSCWASLLPPPPATTTSSTRLWQWLEHGLSSSAAGSKRDHHVFAWHCHGHLSILAVWEKFDFCKRHHQGMRLK